MTNLKRTAIFTNTVNLEEEGTFDGRITDVRYEKIPSQYHSSGFREALAIEVELNDHALVDERFYFVPSISWHPNSKLMQMLRALDMVPAIGEDLNLASFTNLPVKVVFTITESNGVKFSNISQLTKF